MAAIVISRNFKNKINSANLQYEDLQSLNRMKDFHYVPEKENKII